MLGKTCLRISLLILLTAFFYQGGIISKRYIEGLTYYSSSFVDQKDARFPDITACLRPRDPKTYKMIPLKLDEMAKMNYTSDDFLSLILQDQSLFNNFTYSSKWDLFQYIYVRYFELTEDETSIRFSDDYPENDEIAKEMIIVRKHPVFGICKTVRYPDFMKSAGMYYFYGSLHRRNLQNGLYTLNIFIHGQGLFWKTTINTPGIQIERGRIQVQVNYKDVRRLQANKRNDCSIRTQDDCIESFIFNRLKKTYGCRPHWIDMESLPFCSTLKRFNAASKFILESFDKIDIICQKSCDFLDVITGARNYESKKNSYYFFYFNYKVPLWQENYVINGLSFVADVGGYASFLLGVSFYSLTKVAEWLIDLKFRQSKGKMMRNQTIKKADNRDIKSRTSIRSSKTVQEDEIANKSKASINNPEEPRILKRRMQEYPMIIKEFPTPKRTKKLKTAIKHGIHGSAKLDQVVQHDIAMVTHVSSPKGTEGSLELKSDFIKDEVQDAVQVQEEGQNDVQLTGSAGEAPKSYESIESVPFDEISDKDALGTIQECHHI